MTPDSVIRYVACWIRWIGDQKRGEVWREVWYISHTSGTNSWNIGNISVVFCFIFHHQQHQHHRQCVFFTVY